MRERDVREGWSEKKCVCCERTNEEKRQPRGLTCEAEDHLVIPPAVAVEQMQLQGGEGNGERGEE